AADHFYTRATPRPRYRPRSPPHPAAAVRALRTCSIRGRRGTVPTGGQPMAQHTFHIQVGDQVFLEEGGEEIGAVRVVAKDHLVIYIEGGGDFTLHGPEIAAVHDGKVRLDPSKLPPALLTAAQAAHTQETD